MSDIENDFIEIRSVLSTTYLGHPDDEAMYALDRIETLLKRMEWFLKHRTAPEGMTQWEAYKQIDWNGWKQDEG